MAGYTRQSANEIVDDAIIDASDFNNEFNQIVSAFSATTGHAHDGTAAEGPRIEVFGQAGELVGDTANVLKPSTNNTVDLGTSSVKFKDGYFAGNMTVDGNITLGGNLILGASLCKPAGTDKEGTCKDLGYPKNQRPLSNINFN